MRDYFENETKNKTWCRGIKPTAVQIARWLWTKDNILNSIRHHVGIPVDLTSCLRNMIKTQKLLDKGYNPSLKSDHFGGEPVILIKPAHIARFGNIYTFSTFAVDIDGAFDHKKLCRDLYLTMHNMVSNHDPRYVQCFGGCEQLILESQVRKGKLMTWIHVSAPLEAFYSKYEAEVIRKIRKSVKFLEYKNGKYFRTKFE